jgi:peptide subunit release factor 1 (eRF1)
MWSLKKSSSMHAETLEELLENNGMFGLLVMDGSSIIFA